MLIAVISDTHDTLPPQLPGLIAPADEIWHLGDVCTLATLGEIELLGKPLHIIRGNCDEPIYGWPHTLRREIHGIRCQLVHNPVDFARVQRGYCDIILHGHKHIVRDDINDGIRWLSPGSVSLPRGGTPPSFGWLKIEPGKTPQYGIEWLAR